MLEQEMTGRLLDALLLRGYPEDCLIREMPIGEWRGRERIRADLVVVGQQRKVPIAVFEEKSQKTHESIRRAVCQLLRCQSLLRVSAQLFIVVPSASEELEFYAIPTSGEKSLEFIVANIDVYQIKDVPRYEQLAAGLESKYELARQERREERLDEMKPLAWCLALLLFSVFIADFIFNKASLTTQSASILGVSVLVALLPYYDTIVIKDVSLLRKKEGEK